MEHIPQFPCKNNAADERVAGGGLPVGGRGISPALCARIRERADWAVNELRVLMDIADLSDEQGHYPIGLLRERYDLRKDRHGRDSIDKLLQDDVLIARDAVLGTVAINTAGNWARPRRGSVKLLAGQGEFQPAYAEPNLSRALSIPDQGALLAAKPGAYPISVENAELAAKPGPTVFSLENADLAAESGMTLTRADARPPPPPPPQSRAHPAVVAPLKASDFEALKVPRSKERFESFQSFEVSKRDSAREIEEEARTMPPFRNNAQFRIWLQCLERNYGGWLGVGDKETWAQSFAGLWWRCYTSEPEYVRACWNEALSKYREGKIQDNIGGTAWDLFKYRRLAATNELH